MKHLMTAAGLPAPVLPAAAQDPPARAEKGTREGQARGREAGADA